jgi:hypothetical protein
MVLVAIDEKVNDALAKTSTAHRELLFQGNPESEPRQCVHARDLTVPTGVGVVDGPGVGVRKPAAEWRPLFFALLVRVPTSCLPTKNVSIRVA